MDEKQRETARKILDTGEGRALYRMMAGDKAALKQAGAALQAGNTLEAQRIMAPLMENPEVQKLLKTLEAKMQHG